MAPTALLGTMKRGLYGLLLSLALFASTALKAADTDLPFLAFEKFMKVVMNTDEMDTDDMDTDKPEDAMSYLSVDTRKEMKSRTREATEKIFKKWRKDLFSFEPMYFSVKRTGLRAKVVIEGIDQVVLSEARITTVMVWENNAWQVKSWDMHRQENVLLSEVHVWTVGVDETELEAILTGASDRHVELVTMNLEEVRIPMSQLSREDVAYVKKMKQHVGERLKEARARLEEKAKMAGQNSTMKLIKIYVTDHTTKSFKK